MSDRANVTRLTVVDRSEDRGNVVRLKLSAPAGGQVAPFSAGAHLDIRVVDGQLDVWRQYSICSDPAETAHYEIAVLAEPDGRGGSLALQRVAEPGVEFEVQGPRNHFQLDETAKSIVLFAGGIGLTPLLAMAHRLAAIGKPFTLHYSTRSAAVTPFRETLARASFCDRVIFHHSDEPVPGRLDLSRDLPPADTGAHVYACGPARFMEWIVDGAEQRGYEKARIHREYFSASVDATGDEFEVVAQRSGVTVTVGAAETIAKALASAGVKVDVKCEEGVCGTCLTTVLDGIPDHRDHFLTDEERTSNEEICICCSRSRSRRLVLDL